MSGTRVKVYRTPAEMDADVADAAAHGWRVTDRARRPDGTMGVTFAQGGSEWAAPPQVVAQAPPPAAKKKQSPVAGCAVIIVVLLGIGWFASRGKEGTTGAGVPRATVSATPRGFGTMDDAVYFYEHDLDLTGDYNDAGSWYSEVDRSIGLSGTVIKRGGVADELELAIVAGVDDIESGKRLGLWLFEYVGDDAYDWVVRQVDSVKDGKRVRHDFGTYVATVSRHDIPTPVVIVSLDSD